eukprot:Hpha_TRINITY_DN15431_c1_g6::TRINITY_DN15431_c1_g6_i1::g.174113::m.174113/K10226/FADS2; acyl-CoA 6-desaturase (Delta-6 desaturase)
MGVTKGRNEAALRRTQSPIEVARKAGGGGDTKKGKKKDDKIVIGIKGKQLDVTEWASKHPGGNKVLRIFHNRDATEVFDSYHSTSAHKTLDRMLKGAEGSKPVPVETSKSVIGEDFARLTEKMRQEGLFRSDWKDELFKTLSVVVPWVVGVFLLLNNTMTLFGTLCFVFACYMAGWVSHDYLHHSVFKTEKSDGNNQTGREVWKNNLVGYVLGWMQGYEEFWWKARHNTHHVCTNEHGADPDIRTSPVLVYVRNDPRIAKALSAVQRWQQWYYLPLFLIFDVYWRLESVMYLVVRLPKVWAIRRLAILGAHYALMYAMFHDKLQLLAFAAGLRGFLTGVVVFSTHYGEDILTTEEATSMTLVEQTSKTSCNIMGGRPMNFLTGYISLQTEHHLWPMMPTSNLEKAQEYTRAFFKKHGLEYREASIFGCVGRNIRALKYSHLL